MALDLNWKEVLIMADFSDYSIATFSLRIDLYASTFKDLVVDIIDLSKLDGVDDGVRILKNHLAKFGELGQFHHLKIYGSFEYDCQPKLFLENI